MSSKASDGMQLAMDRVAEMVEQISNATREQSYGSELITSAVERMRNLTQEVMHSISNHQNSTAQVVNSSEKINGMVVEICEAVILQAGSSQQISSSMDAFEESTNGQVTSALVMDEVMSKLLCQVAVLQKEIEQFQIR